MQPEAFRPTLKLWAIRRSFNEGGGEGLYNIVMYYVYLLRLNDNTYYTGSTGDVKQRLVKHNKGDVLATKGKRSVELVFYCAFPTKNKALEFEKYLKSGSGQAFRNKHLI